MLDTKQKIISIFVATLVFMQTPHRRTPLFCIQSQVYRPRALHLMPSIYSSVLVLIMSVGYSNFTNFIERP